MTDTPIRIALIGAGIFAREAHVPALLRLRDRFTIVAVCARTTASADALAAQIGGDVASSTDLAALLARGDIEAVDIMLPIDVQPAVVAQALAAGKHVVSEKPIAPDVAAGRELIALQSRHAGPVWMVAENWRYDEAHEQAAALVQDGAIGRVLAVHLAQHASHSPGEKYYDTAWRRSDAFPGGYLLDAGVHYVAVLRMIAGEITAVSAQVALLRSDLPPADSLAATLHFAGGALGVYYTGFAAASPWSAPLTVVGEQGSLRVAQNRVEMVDAAGSVATFPCRAYRGVYRELKAFAAAIRQGQPHRNSPQEGLRDVAVIEGMLEAARTERLVRLAP